MSAQNDVDFNVVVLSSKQFGFIVRNSSGAPLKGVKVHVSCTARPTLYQDGQTND